ncbi:MAG: ABC transporter ATP-binding protein [Nanoarchaeota archaeon]
MLFQIRDLEKRFGKNVVLHNVNLDILEDEIFGIIGVNGSGKTTLLKVLVGFYKPDQGEILYNGQKLSKVLKTLKREIGFTTQENSFYQKLTVEENIRYFGALYGVDSRSTDVNVERILTLVELQEERNSLAENLSGGMQRRLDMACSLIHDPKVLILDEPTEDLDPTLRGGILRLIKKINKLGTTIIITSHLLDDVEHLCNRVAIIHERRIIRVGTVEDLREMYRRKEEVHLEIASGNYENIIRSLNLEDFIIDEGKLVVFTNKAEEVLHSILHILENEGDKLIYVDIRKPSLKEIFEVITDKKWL